jgi:hypothetical protein
VCSRWTVKASYALLIRLYSEVVAETAAAIWNIGLEDLVVDLDGDGKAMVIAVRSARVVLQRDVSSSKVWLLGWLYRRNSHEPVVLATSRFRSFVIHCRPLSVLCDWL